MGFSGKTQMDNGFDLDSKKWLLIAGIPLIIPLKPIFTKCAVTVVKKETENDDDDGCRSTTPTSEEARIPERPLCPPAPKKRKATLKCNYSNREFFTPPDHLETVFIRHVERAN
ncbi:cyclin-dependent protein kinase inhibitor SMR6-like [Mercurialis annua]|uniref:cyclin-dependent protein kinase inhibitor SMR6-like n=1 Tax=Mercurialis annua TaxID=3986 RepID=UPI00215EC630|nr:cyclin-dependent protein kinase inhibitor SMR6-like [Mercurialis annua]